MNIIDTYYDVAAGAGLTEAEVRAMRPKEFSALSEADWPHGVDVFCVRNQVAARLESAEEEAQQQLRDEVNALLDSGVDKITERDGSILLSPKKEAEVKSL